MTSAQFALLITLLAANALLVCGLFFVLAKSTREGIAALVGNLGSGDVHIETFPATQDAPVGASSLGLHHPTKDSLEYGDLLRRTRLPRELRNPYGG